jgi:hypothetical protein
MNTKERLHILISAYLLELGFFYQTSGYRYIRDAVILQINSTDSDELLSREMLIQLGTLHQIKDRAAYSSMRKTLNRAYRKGNTEKFHRLFPEQPVVTEFIQMVAESASYAGTKLVTTDAIFKYLRHFQHTEKRSIPTMCPCCGKDTMNPRLYINYMSKMPAALEQRVYVCLQCHEREEANTLVPANQWSYMEQFLKGGEPQC